LSANGLRPNADATRASDLREIGWTAPRGELTDEILVSGDALGAIGDDSADGEDDADDGGSCEQEKYEHGVPLS
jgi:hypothetical protein